MASPMAEFAWKFNTFVRRHPKTAGGIAAALTVTGGLGAWALVPTRHERLAEWRENYTELCFTRHKDEPELKSYTVGTRLHHIHDAMGALPPYGWEASADFRRDLDQAVFCYDTLKEGEQPFRHLMIGNINLIDENYSDTALAEKYMMDEINHVWYWGVDKVEPRFVASAAMTISRFQRGIFAAERIDMAYHLGREIEGNKVFETPHWQSLLRDNYYGASARAYQLAWNTHDGVHDDQTAPAVMKETMLDLMADTTRLESEDVDFLRRYKSHMYDEERRCITTGVNKDGTRTETCWTEYVEPARYIHSLQLDPQTIVELSALFRNSNDGAFLTMNDVETILDDDTYRQMSERTEDQYDDVQGTIRRYYAYRHETNNAGEPGWIINYDQVEKYFNEAEKKPPQLEGAVFAPGF